MRFLMKSSCNSVSRLKASILSVVNYLSTGVSRDKYIMYVSCVLPTTFSAFPSFYLLTGCVLSHKPTKVFTVLSFVTQKQFLTKYFTFLVNIVIIICYEETNK